MKKTMKQLVPAALLLLVMGLPLWGQTRIATVNLQKVFDKYWRTDQVTAALKDRVSELEKTHQDMVKDWKKQKDEYQTLLEAANNQAVSAEERDRRNKAAEDKLRDIKTSEDNITQFERQAAATIAEQKARMRKNLLEEIKLAIESKAKSDGYSLVIDSGAQTYAADPSGPYYTPTVLYASDSNDLTASVIAQLNAGAPLSTSGSTGKSSSTNDPSTSP
jgi:outer membrane protein